MRIKTMTAIKKLGVAFVIGCTVAVVSMNANAWWDDDDDYYDRWHGGGPWYGGYGWGPGYGYPGYGWGGYPGYGGPRTIIVNPPSDDSQRDQPRKPRLPK
jgi:hypothetical protein